MICITANTWREPGTIGRAGATHPLSVIPFVKQMLNEEQVPSGQKDTEATSTRLQSLMVLIYANVIKLALVRRQGTSLAFVAFTAGAGDVSRAEE